MIDHICDLFAGAGGSGSGILRAQKMLGRNPQGTFVNHWDKAMLIHEENHPAHRHLPEDLFLLDPRTVFPVGTYCSLLWGSPSCTQFSLSRGSKPISEQGRTHAETLFAWISHLRPECIMVENVKEFLGYGPLRHRRNKATKELEWATVVQKANGKTVTKTFPDLPKEFRRGKGETEDEWCLRMTCEGYQAHLEPDPARKGEYFQEWYRKIQDMGYHADYRLMRSCDYGDPTIRTRLIVQFVRKDTGKRVVWPDARFAKPDKNGNVPAGLKPWPTGRNSVIEWDVKGTSAFNRKKALADATLRRQAIGFVKFALPRLDELGSTPYVLPKDQGHKKDYVTSVDHPCCTVQTTSVDHLAEACVIQMNGKSTAISPDQPVGAITTKQKHYLSVPSITHLRGGNGVTSVDAPMRALTAGGTHQVLTEAFLTVMGNAGKNGEGQRAFSPDEPVKTLTTKADHYLAEVSFTETELIGYAMDALPEGVDGSQVVTFLQALLAEVKRVGSKAVKPWVYVYYGSGSVGSDIDTPIPTVRTRESVALCYPAIEYDGQKFVFDILYRMFTVKELQRVQGFGDEFLWPAGITKGDKVKAIGNSVSCGLAEALTLAHYSQKEDIRAFYKP